MIGRRTTRLALTDMLNAANKYYDDRYLNSYFDAKNGNPGAGSGDTLAKFIVCEIREGFVRKSSRQQQVTAAVNTLERAKQDIQSAINGLQEL